METLFLNVSAVL